jgi:small-conductance mechanosensitive channel
MVVMRVNIKELFTSISIIAAAIAIVSKDYISNAINGMILMFNNQISINDHIKIGEHKGKIIHISLLNVQILNEEDDIIFVPNTNLLSQDIINYSKSGSTQVNMELSIDADHLGSFDDLEKYFTTKLNEDSNIEVNTFKLKLLEVMNRKARIRVEVNLLNKDSKSERRFKKIITEAWFQRVKN